MNTQSESIFPGVKLVSLYSVSDFLFRLWMETTGGSCGWEGLTIDLLLTFLFVCFVADIRPQHWRGESGSAEPSRTSLWILKRVWKDFRQQRQQDYGQSSILTPLASLSGLCSSPPQGSRHGLLWRLPWQLRRCDIIGGVSHRTDAYESRRKGFVSGCGGQRETLHPEMMTVVGRWHDTDSFSHGKL